MIIKFFKKVFDIYSTEERYEELKYKTDILEAIDYIKKYKLYKNPYKLDDTIHTKCKSIVDMNLLLNNVINNNYSINYISILGIDTNFYTLEINRYFLKNNYVLKDYTTVFIEFLNHSEKIIKWYNTNSDTKDPNKVLNVYNLKSIINSIHNIISTMYSINFKK